MQWPRVRRHGKGQWVQSLTNPAQIPGVPGWETEMCFGLIYVQFTHPGIQPNADWKYKTSFLYWTRTGFFFLPSFPKQYNVTTIYVVFTVMSPFINSLVLKQTYSTEFCFHVQTLHQVTNMTEAIIKQIKLMNWGILCPFMYKAFGVPPGVLG